MFYICDKDVYKGNDGDNSRMQYGIMDTEDFKVEYYTGKEIAEFIENGVKIHGVTKAGEKYKISIYNSMPRNLDRMEKLDYVASRFALNRGVVLEKDYWNIPHPDSFWDKDGNYNFSKELDDFIDDSVVSNMKLYYYYNGDDMNDFFIGFYNNDIILYDRDPHGWYANKVNKLPRVYFPPKVKEIDCGGTPMSVRFRKYLESKR